MHDTSMDGYESLALAVVVTAAHDYRIIVKCLKDENLPKKDRRFLEGTKREIERFFLSDYGDVLCYGQAKRILKELRSE